MGPEGVEPPTYCLEDWSEPYIIAYQMLLSHTADDAIILLL